MSVGINSRSHVAIAFGSLKSIVARRKRARYFLPFDPTNGGMSIGKPTRMKKRAKD